MIAGGRPSSFFLSSMFPFFPLLKLFSISCTCATNEMYLYPPISGCSFSSLAFLPHRPLSTRLSLLSDDDATHTSPIGSSAPPRHPRSTSRFPAHTLFRLSLPPPHAHLENYLPKILERYRLHLPGTYILIMPLPSHFLLYCRYSCTYIPLS